ncbi:zinc finger protein 628-like [Thrips palmi]|uniref:Zinc finger protein 628-like n=1 Tax=Thrips palmi TaxID=161013 RepID=A0A6P9A8E9_THRPL|nr:zinc finger protein 628-like [Thrips palmi]
MAVAPSAPAMAYQCSKCPKRFASQSNLRRHFVNLHGQDRGPFYCPFCGLFGDSLRLMVDTGEGLVCPVCQKSFTRRDNLKSHFSNLHGEHRGPFRCSFCFKVTKNKMSLRAHMKNYHPNQLQRRKSSSNSGERGERGDTLKLDESPSPLVTLGSLGLGAPLPLSSPASPALP